MSWALYAILGASRSLATAAEPARCDGWRLARAVTLVAGLVALGLAIVIAIKVEPRARA